MPGAPANYDGVDKEVSMANTSLTSAGPPASIRPAVSVLALRGSPAGGIEVFVQHRRKSMDFAGGVVAYPGGRVDPVDFTRGAADSRCPTAQEHARLWGRAVDLSFGPGSAGHQPGQDAAFPAAVLLAAALRELAEETGASAAPEACVPWDVWTTPPGYPRRFDTFFYALDASDLQLQNTTTEASVGRWSSTGDLLEQFYAGDIRLWRPTYTLLRSVHELGDPSEISAGRRIVPDRPDSSAPDDAHHRKFGL